MAQIPSDGKFIFEESVRSDGAVSESAFQTIGGSINYLLEELPLLAGKTLKVVEFTSNGVFTVPSDVQTVVLEGCGGGGGAGRIDTTSLGANNMFIEAGAAAPFITRVKQVVPSATVNILIGAGGVGNGSGDGLSAPFFGSNGGDTVFQDASPVTFIGGGRGCWTSASLPTSTAADLEAYVNYLYLQRQAGIKRMIGEAKGMYARYKEGSGGTSFVYPHAEGSLSGVSNPYTAGGFGVPLGPLWLDGGMGAYGASVRGVNVPNTGAGGSMFCDFSSVTPSFTAYNGSSGRLRIVYVSQF